jgi:hypothetical protein
MKKFVLLLSMLTFLVMPMLAQSTNNGKIVVKTSDLTADQLAKITAEQELENIQKKMEHYGNWVGIGGEIGQAVNEGLLSVVEVSDKFGKTDIGKFTLVMIAWKIMGKDVIRIILGLIFIVVIMMIILKVYKNTYSPKKILKSDPGLFKYPKEYEIIEPDSSWDGYVAVKLLLIVCAVGAFGISYAIMFS